MRFGRIALALALLGACDARISDGTGSSLSLVDSGAEDAAVSDDAAVTPDAKATATCDRRVVFLQFDGQTLTRANASDATKNQASWMQIDTGTAPKFREDDGDRATRIQTITDGVKRILAGFPITVVTQRPASGSYTMIVIGGRASAVGSAFGVAVNTLDCGDLVPNDVAWIAGNLSDQRVINSAIGAMGFGIGLTAADDPNDCMCGWANNCDANNDADCKLGSPIARDANATQKCANAGATQDEVKALHDAYCGP